MPRCITMIAATLLQLIHPNLLILRPKLGEFGPPITHPAYMVKSKPITQSVLSVAAVCKCRNAYQ